MSSGPGASGKPCPRFMASWPRASCDITSKIVTGKLEKIVPISPAKSRTIAYAQTRVLAASFGGKARGFPTDHSTHEVGDIRLSGGLRGESRRHRALAEAAGERHCLAFWIR